MNYKAVIPACAEVLFNSEAGQPSVVALMHEVAGSPTTAFGDDGFLFCNDGAGLPTIRLFKRLAIVVELSGKFTAFNSAKSTLKNGPSGRFFWGVIAQGQIAPCNHRPR